jgi:hypothetical protein
MSGDYAAGGPAFVDHLLEDHSVNRGQGGTRILPRCVRTIAFCALFPLPRMEQKHRDVDKNMAATTAARGGMGKPVHPEFP